MSEEMEWFYGDLLKCKIEPVNLDDLLLPQYLHAQYKGPIMDKILKKKRRIGKWKPPSPKPKCPVSKRVCEYYKECHEKNFCHLK
jgi:hypothetical protein